MTVRELQGHAPVTYTYSPEGVLVSVAASEARFTAHEVGVLLAARRRARAPRGPHGHLMSEATDPKNVGKYKASTPVVDFAEQARIGMLDALEAEYGKEMSRYLTFGIELDD